MASRLTDLRHASGASHSSPSRLRGARPKKKQIVPHSTIPPTITETPKNRTVGTAGKRTITRSPTNS